MATITLNVTDEEKQLITDFSEANNMSISELILKIIEDLEDEEDYKLAVERINDPNNKTCGTLKELATLMIIVSDNQATNILIDFLGMENINLLGKELGLKESFLGRKMMDTEARKNGYDNYTCADDISLLFKLIYQEKLINKEASQLMLDILLRQQQGERLQRYLPSDIKIAHKCGDLDNLENDGGIIWIGDRIYILVVLTSGMSNLQCKQTIGKISKFVYDKMEE